MPIQIHSNFSKLVGQNRAKTLLSAGIAASDRGSELIQPLTLAPKGTGKTELSNGYMDALEAKGFQVLRYSSPTELRLPGDTWDEFTSVISGDKPYALYFDEIHEMWEDGVKNMRILCSFLRKALDRTNENRNIRLSETLEVRFDRTVNVIAGSTNELHVMDEAVVDRFDKIELDLYSEDELKLILEKMIEAQGMEFADDDVSRLIANCGRGTARPLRNIIGEIERLYGIDEPITYDQALAALQLANLYPKGLTRAEVNLLQMASEKEGVSNAQFLGTYVGVTPQELRLSKGYLSSPNIGFIGQSARGGMTTTKRGKGYLKLLQQKGFIV